MNNLINKDTIVALATPPGAGALAIIRVSGIKASKVLGSIFIPSGSKVIKPRQLTLGWIKDDENNIDQAMAVSMPMPNSFTGEDVVEFHLHGSAAVVNTTLQLIAKTSGVREAEPGEFTRRAFLNGKLDLIQAEAVAELIAATNERSAQQATTLLNGGLSKQIEELKSQLITLSAYYVANLDFSEEDIPAIDSTKAIEIINTIKSNTSQIVSNTKYQRYIRDGYKVALVGLPNAGKSTLLNIMLGFDRALVTDTAGTTRDVLSEIINIGGLSFVLSDTAGLRSSNDLVEKLGIERTKQEVKTSDIVLVIIEPGKQAATQKYLESSGLSKLLDKDTTLVIFSKQDKASQKPDNYFDKYNHLSISHQDPKVVTIITDHLTKLAKGKEIESAQMLTSRQVDLLKKASRSLAGIQKMLGNKQTDDIVLVELQSTIDIFNQLSGKHASQEMIDEVFSKFCIGK